MNEWPVKIPSFDYHGKTVVVTGGTKGIGYAVSAAFARCGANVVIASRHQEDCDDVARKLNSLGAKCTGVQADVSKVDAIEVLMDCAEAVYGGIDVLVNCAGVAITKKIFDMTEADYNKVMDTNLKSIFFASKSAAFRMQAQGRKGRIIQIASIGGIKGSVALSVYGATKAAAMNLTKTMALEWSRYGITVNAICPGYVETEINKAVFANPEFREKTLKQIPQRRLGTVDEVAAIALFLTSDLAAMITGEFIVADMGTTL